MSIDQGSELHELRAIAVRYRLMVWLFPLQFFGVPATIVASPALAVVIIIAFAVSVFELATRMRCSVPALSAIVSGYFLAFGVFIVTGMLVGLLAGMLAALILSRQATAFFRRHGVRVGLAGPSLRDAEAADARARRPPGVQPTPPQVHAQTA